MKNIRFPVIFTTAYLVIFTWLALFEIDELLAIILFLVSPVMVVWMVFNVLKNGEYKGPGFNERFYQDDDYEKLPENDPSWY